MKYSEAIAELEKDGKTEIVDSVKSELSKKNNEAENLRERLKGAEAKIKAVKDAGINVDADDISDELAKLKAPEKALSESEKKLKQLEKTVGDLTKSLTEKDAKLKQSKVNSALRKALEAGKAIDPDELTSILSHKVKISDDGEALEMEVDGKSVSVDDGVAAYLKSKPHFVANTQGGGGGSHSGGDSATRGQPFTVDQLASMTPAEFKKATVEKK